MDPLVGNKSFGCFRRCLIHFRGPATLILLFNSLIRPVLKYASVIWSPHSNINIYLIESVQNSFIRFLCYRVPNRQCFLSHVNNLQIVSISRAKLFFNISSLSTRREVLLLCFFHKIINGITNADTILSSIDFSYSQSSIRHRLLFRSKFSTTNYLQNSPYNKFCRIFNSISKDIDIFFMPNHVFKKLCFQLLS